MGSSASEFGPELALAGGISALLVGIAGSIGLGIAVVKLPDLLNGAGLGSAAA